VDEWKPLITGHEGSGGKRYSGAAALGTVVYFAPDHGDNVGVLDTVTGVFTTAALTAGAYTRPLFG